MSLKVTEVRSEFLQRGFYYKVGWRLLSDWKQLKLELDLLNGRFLFGEGFLRYNAKLSLGWKCEKRSQGPLTMLWSLNFVWSHISHAHWGHYFLPTSDFSFTWPFSSLLAGKYFKMPFAGAPVWLSSKSQWLLISGSEFETHAGHRVYLKWHLSSFLHMTQ